MVKDMIPGSAGIGPGSFAAIGKTIYFLLGNPLPQIIFPRPHPIPKTGLR